MEAQRGALTCLPASAVSSLETGTMCMFHLYIPRLSAGLGTLQALVTYCRNSDSARAALSSHFSGTEVGMEGQLPQVVWPARDGAGIHTQA